MSARRKIYVCDIWDDLCDIGEHDYDHRCYATRKDAEKRKERIERRGWGDVRAHAVVVELEACWKEER